MAGEVEAGRGGEGRNKARGTIRRQKMHQRVSDHLERRAVRQKAMMPGPGEVSQTGGVHWRCEPCPFGACAHGVNCVCPGRPSGSQVRAGEQQGTWRYRGFRQGAGPTIPRKSILRQSGPLSGRPLLLASHASHLHGLEKVRFLNLLNQMRLDGKPRSVDS